MFEMRAIFFFSVRDQMKVMEEYCWNITNGKADKPWPICFQCLRLFFNWIPFYIHVSLTIRITDLPQTFRRTTSEQDKECQ